MTASIGNSVVTDTKEKNHENLNCFSFLVAWMTGWIAICMACLYQPFMELWVGKEHMLPNMDMILFCVYFYVINMNNIRNQYVNGTGIWWNLRKSNVFESIGNLSLNIILGKYFGITGVLLATIITIVVFNFLWRTNVLFKTYFKGLSLNSFYRNHISWIVGILIAAVPTYTICNLISGKAFVKMIINGGICLILPNIILFLIFYKTKHFQNAKIFLHRFIKSFGRKMK